MTFYFSSKMGGFYNSKIHGDFIPEDAIKITKVLHQELLAGQAAGKCIVAGPDGSPILVDRTLTSREIEAQKVGVVQHYMDVQARAMGYDNIATAVTYAEEASVPKFQAEGQAFRTWRSLVWKKCYELLASIKPENLFVLTDEELIAMLPPLKFPL